MKDCPRVVTKLFVEFQRYCPGRVVKPYMHLYNTCRDYVHMLYIVTILLSPPPDCDAFTTAGRTNLIHTKRLAYEMSIDRRNPFFGIFLKYTIRVFMISSWSSPSVAIAPV